MDFGRLKRLGRHDLRESKSRLGALICGRGMASGGLKDLVAAWASEDEKLAWEVGYGLREIEAAWAV